MFRVLRDFVRLRVQGSALLVGCGASKHVFSAAERAVEERTTQLMEMSGADWPHMHAMSEVVASAGKGPSPVPASISSEVPPLGVNPKSKTLNPKP